MANEVKLWVGGLPPNVSESELHQRFSSFGKVISCTLAPSRKYPNEIEFERNFGYVTLKPTNEESLERAIAVYDGARWKSHTLGVEPARPDFKERTEAENVNEAAAVLKTSTCSDDMLNIRRNPFRLLSIPVAGVPSQRKTFDSSGDDDGDERKNIGWDSLPLPSGAKYTFEPILRGEIIPPKKEPQEFHFLPIVTKPIDLPELIPQSPKKIKTVDFYSDSEEEGFPKNQNMQIDLTRFASDSDSDMDIPQVDGADDSLSASSGDLEEGDIGGDEASDSPASGSQVDDEEGVEETGTEDMHDDVGAVLAEELPRGAAFVRDEDPEKCVMQWRAHREMWAADYKSKHRQELKKIGSNKRKP